MIRRAFWMVFVLVLLVAYDLDENTLLTFNGLFWVLYVTVIVNIEIMALEQKCARDSGTFRSNEGDFVPVHTMV